MSKNAVIVGNSDGIGLAITQELLRQDWVIAGISRSGTTIESDSYKHHLAEVQNCEYQQILNHVTADIQRLDLCIYCPGIGELFEVSRLQDDIKVFKVNLLGLVKTTAEVIPKMVDQGIGHFIGLSSLADEMLSPQAPSYHASKAGFSNYMESLALALKPVGIQVTNVRFGFVDTKMAKGDVKPFLISVDKAVQHLLKCIERKPIRYSAPKIIIPFIKFRRWMLNARVKSS